MKNKDLFKERGLFCPDCDKMVDFKVCERKMPAKIKGKSFKYTGHVVFCKVCKAELYHGDVNDANLKAMYRMYQQILAKE